MTPIERGFPIPFRTCCPSRAAPCSSRFCSCGSASDSPAVPSYWPCRCSRFKSVAQQTGMMPSSVGKSVAEKSGLFPSPPRRSASLQRVPDHCRPALRICKFVERIEATGNQRDHRIRKMLILPLDLVSCGSLGFRFQEYLAGVSIISTRESR